MYDASTTFEADVPSQGHFQITLAQTGQDTMDADIRQWVSGSDYSQSPVKDSSFHLTGVRALGNKVKCSTSVAWFIADDVEIDVSPAGQTPSVKIAVSGIGGFAQLDPVSQADHDAVLAFLAAANFPAG